MLKFTPIKSLKPDLNDKISLFIGINGSRVILIYPVLAILFITFFNDLGAQYSSIIETVLNQMGISAEITERKVSDELFLLSEYTEYVINIPGTVPMNYPVLLFQKIQFVVVMFSISLGLHISFYKKFRYLMVAVGYWAFVTIQDVLIGMILYMADTTVDTLMLGSIMLTTSAYIGSLLLVFTIFNVAELPKAVTVKPKIIRSHVQYYYVLVFAILATIGIFYIISPILEFIEYNIAVAVLVFSMFNVFRFIAYVMGYLFTIIDKPKRDYSYTPLVTVMIPAKNEEKVIATNIEGVNKSAGNYKGKVELIIINDKSTDDTKKIAEETIKKCTNLTGRVVGGPGKGKSAAMNYGLSQAKGDLVMNLDSDTVITEDAISEVVPYFVDPVVGGVGCHVEQKDERGLLRKMFALELIFIFGLVKPGQQGIDSIMVIIGGASMYQTKILREIGGWGPIKSGDDGDMTLRVGRYGYKIIQYRKKTLAKSEIFPDVKQWFIQRARWYIAFFYTHARNRNAINDRQGGLRATYQMPLVYAGTFTRFTTLLFTEISILMGVASFIHSGFTNIELGAAIGIVVNPMVITIIALAIYYKRIKIIPYFILWPAYSLINAICTFRALMVVMGDEGWESRAEV